MQIILLRAIRLRAFRRQRLVFRLGLDCLPRGVAFGFDRSVGNEQLWVIRLQFALRRAAVAASF